MKKLPKIVKFTGETGVSFKTWIQQFEAQIGALNIQTANKRQVLLCSLDSTAFAVAQDTISANDACTYMTI